MSARPLDIARDAFMALLSGDAQRTRRLVAPDAEWHNTAVFPGERVQRGPDAMLAFHRTLREDFEESVAAIEHELEDGELVALGIHSRGQGKASAAPIDVHWAAVFQVRGQQVTRCDVYGSWERAVRSLGR